MIRVVSLFWGTAWERYGHRFAESFNRYWHPEIELVVVADRDLPLARGAVKRLGEIPGYNEFIKRHQHNPVARGIRPPKGAKVDANGRSWRHDALNWMPQGLAPLAALEGMSDGDMLVWLDGDVRSCAPVSAVWLGDLAADADVACLQRPGTHSEIGFFAVRINRRTRMALEAYAAAYANDVVFELKESHSAFVFDWALAQALPALTVRNLNPKGIKGHPWPQSVLAQCLIHDKGKLKDRV